MQQPDTPRWFAPFKSAGVLLVGKTTQGILSIAYLALAARALGLADFGALVVLNGLIVTVAEIGRFDSWQVVLRYGTAHLESGDTARLASVLKFTLLLDIIGCAFGFAVVLLGLPAAMRFFQLPMEYESAARIFSLSVVFLISTGGAGGILRMLDRFDLIAVQTTVAPILRLAGTLALFLYGGGLEAFLMLWLAATVVGRSTTHVLAWRELKRRGLLVDFSRASAGGLARDSSVWRFTFATGANATLAVVDKHAGLLAVGWLLGPAAAGLFRAALHLADLLIKPSRAFLTPAIYPELARLTARDNVTARERMVWRSVLVAGAASAAVFVGLAVFGQWLIILIFGAEFDGAYGVMLFLALAGAVTNCIFPLEPLLVSIGRVRVTLISRVISVSVYLLVLYAALVQVGLVGAGIASFTYAVLRAALLVWYTRGHLPSIEPD